MNEIISEALKLGLWRQLDVQFAHMLVNRNNLFYNSLMLSVLTLSFYVRRGHVCLPLSMLRPTRLFFGLHLALAHRACEKSGDLSINQWEELLLSSSIVSDGLCLAPLVIDKKKLYLYRMWKNECLVANFFYDVSQKVSVISENKINQIVKLLDRFFPICNRYDDENIFFDRKCVDWQKVAVAMSFIRRVVIISGAPGTGKTSMISKFLVILSLLNAGSSLNIKIATPTGKSAIHLNESIRLTIKKFDLSHNFYKQYFSFVQPVTLHKLLGIRFGKDDIQRVQDNFFFLDYLIIDESSMIDLSMMAKLITVLPSFTKVIFLGDHKQLPSVEGGSVFSDICYFIKNDYTFKFLKELKKFINYPICENKKNKYDISDSFCLLKRNYRFTSSSGIGRLARAISLGDQYMVLFLLNSNSINDLNYVIIKNDVDYFNMLITVAFGYVDYFNNLKFYNQKSLSFILSSFNQYRILCALREGPFGVLRLNSLIENILSYYGFIQLEDTHQNYIGKPIIITTNAPSLSLFNGEIGIMLPDENNNNIGNMELFAYFLSSDNGVKKISLHKLPKYETSFVMTIHKSQGSEFEYIALVFPNQIVPILTRELLYTGVTRARKSLLIYGTNRVINYSMNNQCKRYSGLIDRLKELQEIGLK